MNQFHVYNIEILKQYRLILNRYGREDLSYPLLVSPTLLNKDGKILYVGQETNTWGKEYEDPEIVGKLESLYERFLRSGATNRPFWKFLKPILTSELHEQVIWSNLLLCGKKETLGTPELPQELITLSIDYLYHLYKESNPSLVLIASSSRTPYNAIVEEFLQKIDIFHLDRPTAQQPYSVDKDEKVLWTYHPKYLYMSKNCAKVQEACKRIILK